MTRFLRTNEAALRSSSQSNSEKGRLGPVVDGGIDDVGPRRQDHHTRSTIAAAY